MTLEVQTRVQREMLLNALWSGVEGRRLVLSLALSLQTIQMSLADALPVPHTEEAPPQPAHRHPLWPPC